MSTTRPGEAAAQEPSRFVRTREAFEGEELERLAPFAARSAESRGRVHPEPGHRLRTAFQRDRDRIVHARAFRRLEHKTQVFVDPGQDHHRNRLTHTIEGSQIARSIARALRLNEDLAEAVVLAHDLGHTPFGHAGERVLADLMRAHGGFDHNRQSLRIVDLLEDRYAAFRGLNLTYETREGLLKHGCAWEHPAPLPELASQPSLEAQVADRADEIAYTNHDLDDGLRSGLISSDALAAVPLWRDTQERVVRAIGSAPERVLQSQTIAALIDRLVADLVSETARRLEAVRPASLDAVRRASQPLVAFSSIESEKRQMKRFLHENFYLHPSVVRGTARADETLGELFGAYRRDPGLLPARVRDNFQIDGETRAIADYIAGMTDRFAMEEHRKLMDLHAPV